MGTNITLKLSCSVIRPEIMQFCTQITVISSPLIRQYGDKKADARKPTYTERINNKIERSQKKHSEKYFAD